MNRFLQEPHDGDNFDVGNRYWCYIIKLISGYLDRSSSKKTQVKDPWWSFHKFWLIIWSLLEFFLRRSMFWTLEYTAKIDGVIKIIKTIAIDFFRLYEMNCVKRQGFLGYGGWRMITLVTFLLWRIGHHIRKVVANINRLQHPSSTSMWADMNPIISSTFPKWNINSFAKTNAFICSRCSQFEVSGQLHRRWKKITVNISVHPKFWKELLQSEFFAIFIGELGKVGPCCTGPGRSR